MFRRKYWAVTDGKIRVQLPPAYVTDGYLDETATQVLDRKTGLLRSFDRKLEQQARQEAQTQLRRAARQSGIEREANERAREQLKPFLAPGSENRVHARFFDFAGAFS